MRSYNPNISHLRFFCLKVQLNQTLDAILSYFILLFVFFIIITGNIHDNIAKTPERLTLKWFGEVILHHVVGFTPSEIYASIVDITFDEVVSHIHMTSSFFMKNSFPLRPRS